jgi:hypothetical protein
MASFYSKSALYGFFLCPEIDTLPPSGWQCLELRRNYAGRPSWSKPERRSLRSGSLQAFHRTHAIRSNGTWQLPFGPNRMLLGNGPGWVSRLVERWSSV